MARQDTRPEGESCGEHDIFFQTEDGKALHGRLGGCGRDLVIWSPGVRGGVEGAREWCEPLENRYGYSTFSYDLRGYGESEGSKLDMKEQVLDIQPAIDAAISEMGKRDRGPDSVILIGHSMGAVASLTRGVRDPRVDKVFAMSPVYSVEDLLEDGEKDLPAGKKALRALKKPLEAPWWFRQFIRAASLGQSTLMPKYYLDEESINKVYLVHGREDEYVPFERSGKKIVEKYGLGKNRYLLVDGGHSFEDRADEVLEWIHDRAS